MISNTPEIAVIAGLAINILFSAGTLFKLLEFAQEWGKMQARITHLEAEAVRWRDQHPTIPL